MMLDFLEADWEFYVRRSKEDEADREAILRESLLWHYIIGDACAVNRAVRRRIVKAILATASVESLKDYPEIWEKEIEGPKRRKREDEQVGQVDYETGDMAGYDEDEEMQDAPDDAVDDQERAEAAGNERNDDALHGNVAQLGGMDAIELRQRLIALVR